MSYVLWTVLLAPASVMGLIFISFPPATLLPAAGFYLVSRWSSSRFNLVLACLWLVYGIYESSKWLRLSCSGECNIRVDLLIIYPFLILISILGALMAWWKKRQHKLQKP